MKEVAKIFVKILATIILLDQVPPPPPPQSLPPLPTAVTTTNASCFLPQEYLELEKLLDEKKN